jgi:hypothetical protein
MDYLPLALGLGTFAGLVTYIEITLRREKLSGLRARQSIIDRRLLSMKSAIDRIERRLDAMTVDREVASSVKAAITEEFIGAPDLIIDALSPPKPQLITPSPQPCLDCGLLGAHVANCALNMDDLVESPTDAAARRGRD